MAIRGDEYLVITARDLGAALKHFRTAAGVTQADAAEAMGIGQPYLSSLEGGKFGSSLTHALRCCVSLAVRSSSARRRPVADRLVAWLYDTPIAVLIRGPEFRIRLEWRPEGIERWGLGNPVLSGRACRSAPRPARGTCVAWTLLREHAA